MQVPCLKLLDNGFVKAWRHLDNSFGLALQELNDSLMTAWHDCTVAFFVGPETGFIFNDCFTGYHLDSRISWLRQKHSIHALWVCLLGPLCHCDALAMFHFFPTCWLRNFLWSWPLVRSCISRQIETWSVVINDIVVCREIETLSTPIVSNNRSQATSFKFRTISKDLPERLISFVHSNQFFSCVCRVILSVFLHEE